MTGRRAIGLLLGVIADSAFGNSAFGNSALGNSALGNRKRGEPARAIERLAQTAESNLRRDHPLDGFVYAGVLTGGAVVLARSLERISSRNFVTQVAATAATTWFVLGGAALAESGTALARDLETGDFDAVRDTLATLDPRCTENLDAVELSRASVETVAEHTSESVVAPLAWGVVAGIPGLVGSRAVALLRRRLDTRQHRGDRFRLFPTLLADLVALVPTRAAAALTVSAAPVVGGSAASSWRAWRKDTLAHPSPNAGRVEAAYAGALKIRLGGRTVYPRGPVELPVLGDGRNPDAGHVTRAVELSRVVGWLAALTATTLATTVGIRRRGHR